MKNIFKHIVVVLFLINIATIGMTYAQCAMCRATVESSTKSPKGQGKGLNNGILYLMVIPYLLAGGIGYFWYKHSRKETDKQNKIEDILKRKLT